MENAAQVITLPILKGLVSKHHSLAMAQKIV
jgi:hypothetical protein